MPAKKSPSPDAAQKKLYKAEIKTLEKSKRAKFREFEAERIRLKKAITDAEKAHDRFCNSKQKRVWSPVDAIDRRIGILRGRLAN